MTEHDIIDWVAGDDWEVQATLIDESGQPYDLNGVDIKYALLNAAYQRVLDNSHVDITFLNAAAGKCSIVIPAEVTKTLSGGKYQDVIRVVSGGITSTLAYGPVWISSDPFR
jgi:hypothetical protein